MPKPIFSREIIDKILIAAGLVALSCILYCVHWLVFGSHHDAGYYGDKIFSHIAFLPIHALVLGVIIEGMISFRENLSRRKKLNMFLGIFFRQLGAEFLALASNICANRPDMEAITLVHKEWAHKDFKKARTSLLAFKPKMNADLQNLLRILDMLRDHENDILTMTRNPLVLDFEELYEGLISLLHLIEEIHFRGMDQNMTKGEMQHLAKDIGKALVKLNLLWLTYLEYLKEEHPVLFHCQVGVCSPLGPRLIEDQFDD